MPKGALRTLGRLLNLSFPFDIFALKRGAAKETSLIALKFTGRTSILAHSYSFLVALPSIFRG